jgi:hypothetical protein
MTPGYLTALRQSIRACAKSAKSAKSPPGIPFIALNALFAHPEVQRQSTEGTVVSQCDDPASVAVAHQPWTTLGPAQKAQKAPVPYEPTFHALVRRCPDFVEPDRWRQAVEDGRRFLASRGGQADALGWTARELFGLHTPPERPAANYSRLSRYDETGLIWLLRGRPVIALTETTAAIQGATAVLTYRKLNKPALGPLGDSLDDMGAAT